jgi:hypothetical protein
MVVHVLIITNVSVQLDSLEMIAANHQCHVEHVFFFNGFCATPTICQCYAQWSGQTCDIPTCTPSCINGGTCGIDHTCKCPFGWGGNACEIPTCTFPCLNGGTVPLVVRVFVHLAGMIQYVISVYVRRQFVFMARVTSFLAASVMQV